MIGKKSVSGFFLVGLEGEAEAKTRRASDHYPRPNLTELMAPGAMVWLPGLVAEEVRVRVLKSSILSTCHGMAWHVHCYIHFLIQVPGITISFDLDNNPKEKDNVSLSYKRSH